jgi:hypothetical protein
MGVGECVGDVAHGAARFVDRQRAVVVEAFGEVVAADVRHHEVHEAFRFVDAVDVDDVRMVELCGGFGLAQEARLDLAAERELRRQDLDGDDALQTFVFGAIDNAHPATADLAVQLVVLTQRALHVRAQLGVRGRYGGVGHSRGLYGVWAGFKDFSTRPKLWKGRAAVAAARPPEAPLHGDDRCHADVSRRAHILPMVINQHSRLTCPGSISSPKFNCPSQ